MMRLKQTPRRPRESIPPGAPLPHPGYFENYVQKRTHDAALDDCVRHCNRRSYVYQLLVCRQIRIEVSEVLYGEKTFCFTHDGDLVYVLETLPGRQAPFILDNLRSISLRNFPSCIELHNERYGLPTKHNKFPAFHLLKVLATLSNLSWLELPPQTASRPYQLSDLRSLQTLVVTYLASRRAGGDMSDNVDGEWYNNGSPVNVLCTISRTFRIPYSTQGDKRLDWAMDVNRALSRDRRAKQAETVVRCARQSWPLELSR